MQTEIEIVRYSKALQADWDAFVGNARNGTFLFMRKYMDYHADRFKDCSFLFYAHGKLMAVVPASISGEQVTSHGGLTYGGLVVADEAVTIVVMAILAEWFHYLHNELGINKVIYRPVPAIYHRYPAEEELYALYRLNAVLASRKVSTVIDYAQPLPFSTLRKRKRNLGRRSALTIIDGANFEAFWKVLDDNLETKYHVKPVHSLAEIQMLHNNFPENIVLHQVTDVEGNVLAGCVMFVTPLVAHVQYISSTPEGRDKGALDLLFAHLIEEVYTHKRYFDFGTSVEQEGRWLNEGLIFQKEGFGGRAIVYDTYEIDLRQI